jgi:transposase
MDHVAIDLGGRESQICRRGTDGQVIEEPRVKTMQLRGYLEKIPHSRVIVETCAEAFKIADAALELGHEVRIVPATLAPSLGVGARRLKTDRRDARALSEASCRMDLPSVHIPSRLSRERHNVVGMREVLVSSRKALANCVTGYLRGQALSFTVRARPKYIAKAVRTAYDRDAKSVPAFVERQLRAIDALSSEIDQADDELEATAKSEPQCRRLMTTPGVGPITAVCFLSTIDDVSRFSVSRHVGSYVGITPGESSSSDTIHRLRITKAGPSRLRWLLVQAAWSARFHYKDDPLVQWANQIALRRGTFIATVALARKLSVVMHAMLRDNTDYVPRHRKVPAMTN